MEEGQAYLDRWETNWADTRIHGTTKRQVAAMFAEEKSTLLPLPVEPFRYYLYGERVVHLDGCVGLNAAHAVGAQKQACHHSRRQDRTTYVLDGFQSMAGFELIMYGRFSGDH